MLVKDPYALVLSYAKGLMGFLLFANQAKQVLTIGLGGGSVPKYVWKHCPLIQQTIIEINPQVIRVAQTHFSVPENDDRITIVEADGLEYLQAHLGIADVLMIDAFDGKGIPPDFGTPAFFDDCADTLKVDGLFAMNLWGSDKNFDIYLQRIEQSFQHRVLMMPTGKPGNIIVFGFRSELMIPNIATLKERAKLLMQTHRIDYLDLVQRLQDHNPNDGNMFASRF
jgi:spermidine synthase